MRKTITLLFVFIMGQSCLDSNPYPVDPRPDGPQPRPMREGLNNRLEVRKALSMDVPDTIALTEGYETVVKFNFQVPRGTKAITRVTELPVGAEYDAANFKLSWRPDYNAANDVEDPTVKSRDYIITVWLNASDDSRTKISKKVLLSVVDNPRLFKIESDTTIKIKEGDALNHQFQILNEDFPNGPFILEAQGLPPGAKISSTNDPTIFTLNYQPDYSVARHNGGHLSCATSWSAPCHKMPLVLMAIAPDNAGIRLPVELRVEDRRSNIKIEAPAELTQGLDVQFDLVAIDSNFEVPPQITVSAPKYGDFKTELISNTELHTSIFRVTWNDIPLSRAHTSEQLDFKICVKDDRGYFYQCDNKTVKVNFVTREHQPPVIERNNWRAEQRRYLDYHQALNVRIPIFDPNNSRLAVKVEIEPKELSGFIRWENDNLKVSGLETGIYQFSVKATSEYKTQSAQSFMLEVFPENRSKAVLFTEITRGKEVNFYQNMVKGVDLYNPHLMPVSERFFINRDTLIVGTDMLVDNRGDQVIKEVYDRFSNIIISTPLLNNLPEVIKNEVINDLRISMVGRFSELPIQFPALKDLLLIHNPLLGLEHPQVRPSLAGVSTSESADPFMIDAGLDSPRCQDAFELNTAIPLSPYTVAVHCERIGRGNLVLAGFEFADIAPKSEQDLDIAKRWLETLINL